MRVCESFAKCENKEIPYKLTLAGLSKALYFLYVLVGESCAVQIKRHCIDEHLGF